MAALRWVRALRCTPPQKLVLWALADQANDAGEAWPSVAGLVEATCLSERSVQGAVLELRKKGLLETTIGGGRHRTTTYRLALETPQELHHTPQDVRGNGAQGTPQDVHETPQQVRETPQDVRQTPQELHPNPHNPQEPSEPSITERVPTVRIAGFDDWWRAYPRKVGKGAARVAYTAAVKRGVSEAELAQALQRQQWPAEERFIPHARTWLTQDRWLDEPGHASAKAESLTDTIANLLADPMGQGPPRHFRDRADFEGTAEEIFRV
ncbi:helix-turn-helix domain-containing protein [Roseococcus pinisoli]|uniref:Helix-turn-helix domain-containing protein n=1 Tax=Roseococcus pinisoli TaxID=2835040 RepID=A0ABS5QCP4_9PROT|nr:helix-turn-helix domain-containing protein [Roseococcus pinisoli]MBS7811193.1 helix-turn-helix domain-containing protein [Roseococcus pinisoli]